MRAGLLILSTVFYLAVVSLSQGVARADTVVFFNSGQVANPVGSTVTTDTISSNGYLFTYTRDKLYTGGTGTVIGRPERIHWPQGVEAQAVTTPPPGSFDYKARITLKRVDGDVFDVPAFSVMLLANTAGAGGAVEVMPLLNGEAGLPDPAMFNASGYYGSTFSYDETTVYAGTTTALRGFDEYRFSLYTDFALTGLRLVGAPVPEPASLSLMALAGLALRRRPGR